MFSKRASIRSFVGLTVACLCLSIAPAVASADQAAKAGNVKTQVKKLKKPSVAAWVVNQLVRHETEQVEQVLAMGEALRAAQRASSAKRSGVTRSGNAAAVGRCHVWMASSI